MRGEDEWWVGTDDGRVFYTLNAGKTWTEKSLPGSLSVIYDIAFSTAVESPLFVSTAEREQIHRVIQEALLNAQHHGDPNHITVSLSRDGGDLVVTIEDDGKGFDPEASPSNTDNHFGLSIMRARAARLSGKLEIHSAPHQGTSIVLR